MRLALFAHRAREQSLLFESLLYPGEAAAAEDPKCALLKSGPALAEPAREESHLPQEKMGRISTSQTLAPGHALAAEDDTKAELELEAIDELEDKIAPELAANHNETLVRDLKD